MSGRYARNRQYTRSRGISSGPSTAQLSYLNDLAIKAGYEDGTSGQAFRERFGLYESSPWGNRLRSEAITSAAVSAWIDILKSEIAAKETDQ